MLRQGHPIRIALIDFGFACHVKVDDAGKAVGQKVYVGTPEFQSPEIVAVESFDPRFGDMWALGVVAHMCCIGVAPFFHNNRKILGSMIRKCKALSVDPKDWDHLSKEAPSFCSSLICSLENRMSAKQAMDHAWFKSGVSHVDLSGFAEKARILDRKLKAVARFRAAGNVVIAINKIKSLSGSLPTVKK